MGYMIFQFQKELGFETNASAFYDGEKRTSLQKNMDRIDVLIKEGRYDSVIRLYKETILKYPEEKYLKPNFLELLLASKDTEQLDIFMPSYESRTKFSTIRLVAKWYVSLFEKYKKCPFFKKAMRSHQSKRDNNTSASPKAGLVNHLPYV